MNDNLENINLKQKKINIEEHLGLVHSCAQRFRGRGLEYDDIFQSGCIGLTKAANKFDFSRGLKFSTYAIPVILGEIKSLFRDNNSIKISRKIKEFSNKVKCERENFIKFYEREPTVSELSDCLGVESEQILEVLDTFQPVISLDESYESGESVTEVSVDFDDEKIFNLISVHQTLKKFPMQDKNIIYFRFFKGKTQSETAKNLGMTQVQVSRREKALLKELRKKLA